MGILLNDAALPFNNASWLISKISVRKVRGVTKVGLLRKELSYMTTSTTAQIVCEYLMLALRCRPHGDGTLLVLPLALALPAAVFAVKVLPKGIRIKISRTRTVRQQFSISQQ